VGLFDARAESPERIRPQRPYAVAAGDGEDKANVVEYMGFQMNFAGVAKG